MKYFWQGGHEDHGIIVLNAIPDSSPVSGFLKPHLQLNASHSGIRGTKQDNGRQALFLFISCATEEPSSEEHHREGLFTTALQGRERMISPVPPQ